MAAAAATAREESAKDHEEKIRWFNNFLHNRRDDWKRKIMPVTAKGDYRIPLDLLEIEREDPGIMRRFVKNPVSYILPWEEALLQFLRDIDAKGVRHLKHPLKLDINGPFGENHVTPRGMDATKLQQMVCVEGMVTKCGLSTPKLLQSIHVRKHGDNTNVESRDHRDATAFVTSAMAGAMPTQDADGNELEIELGLSVYKDYQKFNIQETPEQCPPGQIPRMIEVICEGDLADRAKPGERIQVIGVYRSFPPPSTPDFTNGIFPARLIATSIKPLKELIEQPFHVTDIDEIRKISERSDTFELLARSFAPAICGHLNPKKGLLLQMIGGTQRELPNGTKIRGDLNVLLIGDPSCGKSQMLRFVMNIAQRAVSTTGKGSSGVGLTAAVTRDPGSRDFCLEAGAMVLADRGVICIDEFDKMGISDRVAIHEAMEQQCVTIAKAGMHCTLNARCSVTAAANPIYGSFDSSLDLAKNIGMPDSLLSRFDLVFVVRDITTEEIDRKIATQVLRQAQTRDPHESRRRGVEQIHSTILQRRQETARAEQDAITEVFEKQAAGPDGEERPQIVTIDFLRKYLRFCKARCPAPLLTAEAQAEVADRYVDMRRRFQSGFADLNNPSSNKKPRLAVTTRTLEALIRLATAHAKLKLRHEHVIKEDVIEAYKLMLSAREEDFFEEKGAEISDESNGNDQNAATEQGRQGKKREREETVVSRARVDALTVLVARAFASKRVQELQRNDLLERVNAELYAGEELFNEDEFAAGLEELEARNKVMVHDETGDVILMG